MGLCQHWLFMHPQILHVKALTPGVMVLGGTVLGAAASQL